MAAAPSATWQILLAAANTGSVVVVLVAVILLGLRGDVVPSEQLRDCRITRDIYLDQILRSIDALPHPTPRPSERFQRDDLP